MAHPLDPDGDGITESDNCPWHYNKEQCDSDGGLGNRCDFDFDNSGWITLTDFNMMFAKRGLIQGEPGWESRFDINCDGAIEDIDLTMFRDTCEHQIAIPIEYVRMTPEYTACRDTIDLLLPEPSYGLLFGILMLLFLARKR